MAEIRARQVSMLTILASMVALGTLGLTGFVPSTPRIGAVLLAAAVVLAFALGRQSVDLW